MISVLPFWRVPFLLNVRKNTLFLGVETIFARWRATVALNFLLPAQITRLRNNELMHLPSAECHRVLLLSFFSFRLAPRPDRHRHIGRPQIHLQNQSQEARASYFDCHRSTVAEGERLRECSSHSGNCSLIGAGHP